MTPTNDRTFEFTHEGISFQCRMEPDAEHAADEAARTGRWVVEVGGAVHALCEASDGDTPERIRERAVEMWQGKPGNVEDAES